MGVSSSPSWHLTASLLRLRILRLVDLYHLTTFAKWVLSRLAVIQGLAGNDAVDFYKKAHHQQLFTWPPRKMGEPTCEDVLESKLHVAGIEGRGLDEREVVLACSR